MAEKRASSNGWHLSSCDADQVEEPQFSLAVLGPLRVCVGGRDVIVSSRRQRALLMLLAVNANTAVPVDRLVDQLWDGAPPPGALVTVRAYVSHLRKVIQAHAGGAASIVTTGIGYRLDLAPSHLDLERFRRAVAAGHDHQRADRPQAALDAFDAALELWRGEPLAELGDHLVVAPLRTELKELRLSAIEGRLRALVEIGRHVEAISELESLVAQEPLRESPHELLMVALYRAGRTAEALGVHRQFTTTLRDQLGLDASERFEELVALILRRDPRLDSTAHVSGAPIPPSPLGTPSIEVVVSLVQSLQAVSEQLAAAAELLSAQLTVGTTPAYGSRLAPGSRVPTSYDAMAS
jgi:DNA-binding SARP family transcriptional activator